LGNKLGKMVKIVYILVVLIIGNLEAKLPPDLLSKDIAQSQINPPIEEIAQIYSISGTKDGIRITEKKIIKPGFNSLKNLKLLTPRDDYALKILDEDKKEIILLGIGNPFYIHAQHIDYEDSRFFGGYINAEFEIALPLDMDVSHIVLMSQHEKVLTKINEIEVE